MVVSDSSPLINLVRIGKLTILWDLYGELHIPEACQLILQAGAMSECKGT